MTFRGSVNLNDWFKNIQISEIVQKVVQNPVSNDSDEQTLRSGFYNSLQRERKAAFKEVVSPPAPDMTAS